MPPWATDVAKSNPTGHASPLAVEWEDLLAFFVPVYGRMVPEEGKTTGYTGICVWLAALLVWVGYLSYGKFEVVSSKIRRPRSKTIQRIFNWLLDGATYQNLDLTVSLYMLSVASVLLSGLYAPADMRFANTPALFGSLKDDSFRRHIQWFCALTALTSSLLLVRAGMGFSHRDICRNISLSMLWACGIAFFYVRYYAVVIVHEPRKSIVAVDWAFVAILFSLSARCAGVPGLVCSGWLRKFVTMTMAVMYFNAGLAKLWNTGWVWYTGTFLRKLMKGFRHTSAWPWANDMIVASPTLGFAFGIATFVFEIMLSFLVLLAMLPSYSQEKPSERSIKLQEMLRLGWAVVGVGMHLSIYVLLYPPFTTFVHVLLFLALDPFVLLTRYQGKTVQLHKIDEKSDLEGGPLQEKESACMSTVIGVVILSSIFFFCTLSWLAIGIRCPGEGKEPWFPFSSMGMYSSPRYIPNTVVPGE